MVVVESPVAAEIARLQAADFGMTTSSPWGRGSEDFPLTEAEVEACQGVPGFVATASRAWSEVHGQRPSPDPTIPRTVPVPRYCSAHLPDCEAKIKGTEGLEESIGHIKKRLQVFFAKRGSPITYGRHAMLRSSDASAAPLFVQCISARKTPFEAEFVRFDGPCAADADLVFPFRLLMGTRSEYGEEIADLLTEDTLALRLAKAAGNWSFAKLTTEPVTLNSETFDKRQVMSAEAVDVEQEIEAERALLSARQAMGALRRHHAGPAAAANAALADGMRARGRGGRRGPRGGRGGRGRGGRLAPADAIAALEDLHDEDGDISDTGDTDGEVAAELQEEWAGALAAADAREAGLARAGGADGLAPPVPPLPPPPLPPAGSSGSASSGGAGSSPAPAPALAAEPSELREIPGGYVMRGNHRIGRVVAHAFFSAISHLHRWRAIATAVSVPG